MLDLIKRLEEATGPITASKEMEALISASPWYVNTPSRDPIWGYFVRALGGSIDAAVALAERVLPLHAVEISVWKRSASVRILMIHDDGFHNSAKHGRFDAVHKSEAIARVIAILKAKEASSKPPDDDPDRHYDRDGYCDSPARGY